MKKTLFLLCSVLLFGCSESTKEGELTEMKEDKIHVDTMYLDNESAPSNIKSDSPFLILRDSIGNKISSFKKGESISLTAELEFHKTLDVISVVIDPYNSNKVISSNQFRFVVPDTSESIIIHAHANYNHVGVYQELGETKRILYDLIIAGEDYKILD